jgi:hypothetical protein
MVDVIDLEIRYKDELKQAKAYLSSKMKKAGRTPANSEQKKHFLDKEADCPQCGDPFLEGNHNTEHIFPIALGGKNTATNRIQLCRMCNNSRNKVMQSSFADNPRSIYPEKWPQIKRVLLWHIVTIDDGVEAGKIFPTTHALFMKYSTGGKPFPNIPKRAYGPFSTWKVGDDPNYVANNATLSKKPGKSESQTNWRAIGRNLLDKFFLYEPKKTKPSQQSGSNSGKKSTFGEKPESKNPQPVDKTPSSPSEGIDKESFVKAIMKLIPNENATQFQFQTSFIGKIGLRIRKMQEAEGWEKVGTKPFLVHFGFRPNFGLMNALKHSFGNQLEIVGQHPNQKIRILTVNSQPIKEDFPKVRGFNTASAGSMCLPHLPSEFALCIKDYHSNQSQINTTAEIFERFKKILGGKRRASALEQRISFVVLPPNTTYENKDWSKAKQFTNPHLLSEAIRNSIVERAHVFNYQGSEIPDLVKHTHKYFDMVSTHFEII